MKALCTSKLYATLIFPMSVLETAVETALDQVHCFLAIDLFQWLQFSVSELELFQGFSQGGMTSQDLWMLGVCCCTSVMRCCSGSRLAASAV